MALQSSDVEEGTASNSSPQGVSLVPTVTATVTTPNSGVLPPGVSSAGNKDSLMNSESTRVRELSGQLLGVNLKPTCVAALDKNLGPSAKHHVLQSGEISGRKQILKGGVKRKGKPCQCLLFICDRFLSNL